MTSHLTLVIWYLKEIFFRLAKLPVLPSSNCMNILMVVGMWHQAPQTSIILQLTMRHRSRLTWFHDQQSDILPVTGSFINWKLVSNNIAEMTENYIHKNIWIFNSLWYNNNQQHLFLWHNRKWHSTKYTIKNSINELIITSIPNTTHLRTYFWLCHRSRRHVALMRSFVPWNIFKTRVWTNRSINQEFFFYSIGSFR